MVSRALSSLMPHASLLNSISAIVTLKTNEAVHHGHLCPYLRNFTPEILSSMLLRYNGFNPLPFPPFNNRGVPMHIWGVPICMWDMECPCMYGDTQHVYGIPTSITFDHHTYVQGYNFELHLKPYLRHSHFLLLPGPFHQ